MTQNETGRYKCERLVVGLVDKRMLLEHVYRYKFAAKFVRDKIVLDIACGEGYGTEILSRAGAKEILGVDKSFDACQSCQNKYRNISVTGDAINVPLQSNYFDIIVSFETLEHLEQQTEFIDECYRVLVPNGLLIISTPDKIIYHSVGRFSEHHCSELTYDDFFNLVKRKFEIKTVLFQQHVGSKHKIHPYFFSSYYYNWDSRRFLKSIRDFLIKISYKNLYNEEKDFEIKTLKEILKIENLISNLVNPYKVHEQIELFKYKSLFNILVAKKN